MENDASGTSTTMTREVDPCVAVDGYGNLYREFSCLYPSLKPLYFEFETYYDATPVNTWMRTHSELPVGACLLYLAAIFLGQAYFAKKERWNWRHTMTCWNFLLSTFSFVGFVRTAPHLAHNLVTMSLHDNLCVDPHTTYGGGSTGLWTQLFILSKLPELFDTFFIVIHKKPLIFLHWYHHVTVLLYCWHSYVTVSPPGIFFVVMNYAVHSIMYFYYGLMAARIKPKWLNPVFITVAQISQMVVGVVVTCLGFYYSQIDADCHIRTVNNTAAFVMYGSYLFLFLQFFVGRYNNRSPKTTKKKTTKTETTNSTATARKGDKVKRV